MASYHLNDFLSLTFQGFLIYDHDIKIPRYESDGITPILLPRGDGKLDPITGDNYYFIDYETFINSNSNQSVQYYADDFNGDGFSDLSIGSPGFTNNNGIVEFSFGSQAGLSENLAIVDGISNPSTTGESYGACLEYVKDLNNDGYDDIIVCSRDHDLSLIHI